MRRALDGPAILGTRFVRRDETFTFCAEPVPSIEFRQTFLEAFGEFWVEECMQLET